MQEQDAESVTAAPHRTCRPAAPRFAVFCQLSLLIPRQPLSLPAGAFTFARVHWARTFGPQGELQGWPSPSPASPSVPSSLQAGAAQLPGHITTPPAQSRTRAWRRARNGVQSQGSREDPWPGGAAPRSHPPNSTAEGWRQGGGGGCGPGGGLGVAAPRTTTSRHACILGTHQRQEDANPTVEEERILTTPLPPGWLPWVECGSSARTRAQPGAVPAVTFPNISPPKRFLQERGAERTALGWGGDGAGLGRLRSWGDKCASRHAGSGAGSRELGSV